MLTGARGFNRRVQRQQVSLFRNPGDNFQNAANVFTLGIYLLDDRFTMLEILEQG